MDFKYHTRNRFSFKVSNFSQECPTTLLQRLAHGSQRSKKKEKSPCFPNSHFFLFQLHTEVSLLKSCGFSDLNWCANILRLINDPKTWQISSDLLTDFYYLFYGLLSFLKDYWPLFTPGKTILKKQHSATIYQCY